MKITMTQEQILKAVSCLLFGSNQSLEDICDWNQVLSEAKEQGVFLLIFKGLRDTIVKKLDDEDVQKWDKLAFQYIYANLQNSFSHSKVHDLLHGNGIPYVIMKGQASALYYPEPLLRIAGDVDFLINPEDIEKTTKVLNESSYLENQNNTCEFHLAFHKMHESLEMHWEPSGIPDGKKGDLCRAYMADAISTAVLYKKDDTCFYIPDRFHHGLIILLHIAHHMIEEGVGLRHLCDWAVFVNSISNEEFCVLFEDKLKKVGLWRFAQLLTQVSVRYLGCEYKQWADEDVDNEHLDQLIADIFAGGNFGRKDTERKNEAKLLSVRAQRSSADHGIIVPLYINLADKARKEIAICDRIPILVPFGCVYILFRHFNKIRTGKKPKIHVTKMIHGVNKRADIYREFKLFR